MGLKLYKQCMKYLFSVVQETVAGSALASVSACDHSQSLAVVAVETEGENVVAMKANCNVFGTDRLQTWPFPFGGHPSRNH